MKNKRICPCEGHTLDRLLQPAVMALLRQAPLRGYALIDRLESSPLISGCTPDPSGVYRMLSALEEQGLVCHGWSKSNAGPAKRLYELTPAGTECVGKWVNTLDKYQKGIAQLIAMMRGLNPE